MVALARAIALGGIVMNPRVGRLPRHQP